MRLTSSALRHESAALLILSAVAAAVVLSATTVVGLVVYRESVFVGFALVPLFLVPFPAVTAALAGSRKAQDWVDAAA